MDTKDITNDYADQIKILADNGIYTVTLNDQFNSAMLKSMQEYSDLQSKQMKDRIVELEDALNTILNARHPFNEKEFISWVATARTTAIEALNNKHK